MNDHRTVSLPLDACRHRYQNDATYKSFVDMCRMCIEQLSLSPSEVREASMLACFMVEERRTGITLVADPTLGENEFRVVQRPKL